MNAPVEPVDNTRVTITKLHLSNELGNVIIVGQANELSTEFGRVYTVESLDDVAIQRFKEDIREAVDKVKALQEKYIPVAPSNLIQFPLPGEKPKILH